MTDIKRNLVFRGIFAQKTAIEQLLRQIMADSTITQSNYLYSAIESETKIKIYRSHPGRLEFYPSIIISSSAFSPNIITLGIHREKASDGHTIGGDTYDTATGYVNIPIILSIFAKQPDDRDILTDFLVSILRVSARGMNPIVWWNNIAVSGEDQMVAGKDIVYTNTITINTHTDYSFIDMVDQTKIVNKAVAEVIAVLQFS